MEIKDLIQIILAFAGVAAVLWVGWNQNEINKRALNLNDYADVFLMPQTLLADDEKTVVGYKILIKNASAFPIYLNKYIINGTVYEVGTSMIPANTSDQWYGVPITKDVQDKKYFSISVFFEDYSGRKYQTDGSGVFDGGWGIKTQKRKVLE